MEERQSEQKILDVLEKNRSRAAVGFLLLFLGSAGLLYFVLTGKTRVDDASPAAAIEVPESSDERARHLDGMLVPTGEEGFAPYAVMIENHPDARPLSGISKAQVVIEAPVEGGITRFVAFLDPSTDVDEIGPVRSARPYYVEWADSWHAFYAHVGGSPEGLRLIQTKNQLIDIDQFRYGNVFWRSILRFAPHNVYTSMERLSEFAEENDLVDETMPKGWDFFPRREDEESGDVESISIPYGGIFNVTWEYEEQEDHFIRYQNGSIQKDKDGSVVTAKNVIVIETEAEVLDSQGRLSLRTTGEGDAFGFRNGNTYDLTWRRSGDGIMEFWLDDEKYELEPGTTWVEVVTDEAISVSKRDDS